MARLTAPNGVSVEVADDRVEQFTRLGYKPVASAPAKKAAPKKASSK